jgi:anthranilate phosphoribosyltransferase
MKNILDQLIDQQPLSRDQAQEIMHRIANEEFSEAEVAAFLTTYLMRPISVDELTGFRQALMELSLKADFGDFEAIDLCGTGGDGKNTFNISTLSAFVVAGAGYKVIKHGNYGVSSISGSSNVLEYLGYKFTSDTDKLKRQVDEHNICFLHAPLFHPAMKAVGPTRRNLKVKTFFNLLGPLVNPASPSHQLVGVYDLHVARLYQFFLQQLNRKFIIVHGLDGYDEVSLTGASKVIGNNMESIINSKDFGLGQYEASGIYGGQSVAEAGRIFTDILERNGTRAQEDVVIANAALAVQCFEPNRPLLECVIDVRDSLYNGSALRALKSLLS